MLSFSQKNQLAEAYYPNGEPIYQELVTLFGDEQAKVGEDEQTLIILPDSSDKAPLHAPVISLLQAWSEEVNSPVWLAKEKIRHKVFVDSDHDSDRCQTNVKDVHSYTVGPNDQMEIKAVGLLQLKLLEVASKPYYSPKQARVHLAVLSGGGRIWIPKPCCIVLVCISGKARQCFYFSIVYPLPMFYFLASCLDVLYMFLTLLGCVLYMLLMQFGCY